MVEIILILNMTTVERRNIMLENARYAVVNLSTTQIPVYSSLVESQAHVGGKTAGGTVVGKIYKNEFYTLIPNDSMYITSFKIYFRDGNGNCRYGYIETSPGYTLDDYAWKAQQHPYHYYNSSGSALTASEQSVPINGIVHRVFTVARDVTYRAPNGTVLGTISAGMELLTRASTTGVTYPGYMIFYYKGNPGSAHTKMNANYDYAFVDLDLKNGSMPNNRAIK